MLTAPAADPAAPLPKRGHERASLAAVTDAIHVWNLPGLNSVNPHEHLADLRSTLSVDEAARADRFHFAEHRDAFIANRGRLRLLLAHYLDGSPQNLRFRYGAQGKPALVDEQEHGLNFNLSHTDGLAVVAVARHRRLGVDVEKMKPVAEILDIANKHFSPAEYSQLCATNPVGRLHAFYCCWTRKEAFLKGLGEGLQRELAGFQVSFPPEQPPALLACDWDLSLCRSWQIQHLQPGDRYIGALAYEESSPINNALIESLTWLD
jgi:4'-phosphopantetheinyl transferase